MMDCWIIGKGKRIGMERTPIRQSSNPKIQSSGFTMIELLVVMAIIVVIATVSIPTIEAMTSPKHALRKQGRQVMRLMSEARTAAINRKVRVDLHVDPENRAVHMVETQAFRMLSQESSLSLLDLEEATNRYEKTLFFDEDFELGTFTAEQIIAETEAIFQVGEATAPENNTMVISFNHFGGSNGSGISLVKDGVQLDIAADILTGRPKIVKRTGLVD